MGRLSAKVGKSISAFLAFLFVFISVFSLATDANAAGKGYSDMFRMYYIIGMEKDSNIDGIALLYGKDGNAPADNYAVVMKTHGKRQQFLMDVIGGDKLEAVLKNSLGFSQIEVNNYNEFLLANGAEDNDLLLEEKPVVVGQILKAISDGKSSVVSKDNMMILPDALKLAAQSGGANFKIHNDNMNGKAVDVRLTITPSKTTKGIVTAAGTNSHTIDMVIAKYAKTYSNKLVGIDFLQEGNFGTTVQVAAKVDLKGLNTKNLVFYSYNPVTNKQTMLETVDYSVDEKGFLQFSTTMGNIILISDKALTKK